MTLSFKEQYLHPSWQKRRLEVLKNAGWVCACCNAEDKTLHVHHKRYVKGRMVWEYGDDELQALCDECHAASHERKDFLQQLMLGADLLGMTADRLAIGLIGGYLYVSGQLSEELAQEAYAIAGPAFEDGMVGYRATAAPGAEIAALIRIATERWGAAMPPLLEEVLTRLEAAKSGDL